MATPRASASIRGAKTRVNVAICYLESAAASAHAADCHREAATLERLAREATELLGRLSQRDQRP